MDKRERFSERLLVELAEEENKTIGHGEEDTTNDDDMETRNSR